LCETGTHNNSIPEMWRLSSDARNATGFAISSGVPNLLDSFRYLVIRPERHCLSAASSVNTRTSRYLSPVPTWITSGYADNPPGTLKVAEVGREECLGGFSPVDGFKDISAAQAGARLMGL
jgi:hypothetical protein